MKFFEASILLLIKRFYLMMAVVIIPFFAGVPWLALLSLPILLSAMLGITFGKDKKVIAAKNVQSKVGRLSDIDKSAA